MHYSGKVENMYITASYSCGLGSLSLVCHEMLHQAPFESCIATFHLKSFRLES